MILPVTGSYSLNYPDYSGCSRDSLDARLAAPARSKLEKRATFQILEEFHQFSAWPEKRDLFGGNFHCCASFGIASHPRSSFARVEAAETTEFDFIATS